MKLGGLHNLMMEVDLPAPTHLGNNSSWISGWRAGAYRAKLDLSMVALRYEGYTKKLEEQLALMYSEEYVEAIKKEAGL